MNPKLKEINELIALCDQMLFYIQERGDIRPNNDLYLPYKFKVAPFANKIKLTIKAMPLMRFYVHSSLTAVHIRSIKAKYWQSKMRW